MRYRSRIDIIASILKSATDENGTPITKMINSSYLSHAQTKEYLPLLAEKKLLEYHKDSRRYKITIRGEHFLKLYNDVFEMLKVTPMTK